MKIIKFVVRKSNNETSSREFILEDIEKYELGWIIKHVEERDMGIVSYISIKELDKVSQE